MICELWFKFRIWSISQTQRYRKDSLASLGASTGENRCYEDENQEKTTKKENRVRDGDGVDEAVEEAKGQVSAAACERALTLVISHIHLHVRS